MNVNQGNRNYYNYKRFGHLTRNCENRKAGNKIGEGKRLEYGGNKNNEQRRIIEGGNGQDNLNGK